jgi:hypothetical protein
LNNHLFVVVTYQLAPTTHSHISRQHYLQYSNFTLSIIPLMTTLDTFVKHTHGFIGTSNLHLHKVCIIMIARGTYGPRSIDVFPRSGSAQDIIHLFLGRPRCMRQGALNGARVRTCGADKFIGSVVAVVTLYANL